MSKKKQIICLECKAKIRFDLDKIISEVVKFRCPGCSSVLLIRKPEASKESMPTSKPTETEEANKQRPEILESNNELRKDSGAVPVGPEEAEREGAANRKTLPKEEHAPLIQEERLTTPEKQEEPEDFLLEDYDHKNLREYEEGEPNPRDLEWTRNADSTGPEIPESKIDLNLIPVSLDGLQDTLADLQQAEMYNFQGEHHLGKNLIKQAIRDFNHALEINPDYVDALVNRGRAFALQKESNAALADFNHALELENKQTQIYNLRGEIYLHNRMYDEAIKDFTTAIILNPIYSDAYLNRAKAYSEKGMTEEAENDFNQAIRSDSEKFSSYVDLADLRSLFEEDNISS